MSIYSTIRNEVDDFIYNNISVVDGYNFNQYETIKRIHLYLNSQFENGSFYNGREKIFFNIVKNRKDAVSRFFDVDTKDIKLMPLNPKSEFSTLFLEKELQYWVKKNKIGLMLNKIADELVSYGSVVIRKTKKGAKVMDLRNLFLDPTVEDIQKSRFVIIKHYFTTTELRAKVKDGWDSDAVERIIRRKEEDKSNAPESYEDGENLNVIRSTPYIEVYERFGEVEEHYIKGGKSDKLIKALCIVAEPYNSSQLEDGSTSEKGEILFISEWNKDYPFVDCHYSKTAGRWLGVGVVEDLFPAQERMNELKNQQRISMELSSLHLFQTQDKTIVNNLLTDLRNGAVLQSKSGINPIVNEERNLSAFLSEEERYNILADKISFANDLITGSQLPASTPATNAVIQNNNAVSVFLFKRQNLTLWLQEFFNEFVLPQVLKDLSAEHMVRFTGDAIDLSMIDEEIIKIEQAKFVLNANKVIIPEELQANEFSIKAQLAKFGSARYGLIKEKLYDDLEFEFDILIGGEQEDVNLVTQNTKSVLIDIANNPAILANPATKLLFSEYARRVGVNPTKLEMALAKSDQQIAQQQQLTQQFAEPTLPQPTRSANEVINV